MKTTVFLVLLVLTTCNGQKKTAADSTQNAQGEGPEEKNVKKVEDSDYRLGLVASDSYSGIEQAETLIIRDAKSLQKFYSKVNRTRKPGLPVPDIDFSREMVVVRCSGAVEGGAVPELGIRKETDDEIVLGIRETGSVSNSSAVTTPFSVYRMPLTAKEVIVKKY
jgi:hypothetical protein